MLLAESSEAPGALFASHKMRRVPPLHHQYIRDDAALTDASSVAKLRPLDGLYSADTKLSAKLESHAASTCMISLLAFALQRDW